MTNDPYIPGPFSRRMRVFDELPRDFRTLFREYGAYPGPRLRDAILEGRIGFDALRRYLEERSKEG